MLKNYTDLGCPSDAPDFIPAAGMDQYLKDYAKHFGLMEHTRLRTSFHGAKFHKDGQRWALSLSTPESPVPHWEYFDKVVFAMGTDQTPVIPEIEGIEKFKGFQQHSMSFKE
jgi:cation diffusion facilitator CzcD-associated flavoprotein CzcO